MKKCLLFILCAVVVSCGINPEEHNRVIAQRDSLLLVVKSNETTISGLRDSVKVLSYPANQRLAQIKALVRDSKYSEARLEIRDLKLVFPKSAEAALLPAIESEIEDAIQKKAAEEARIKALGFKAIKAVSTAKIGYNTITISNISVGSRFSFDDYGDTYYYRTADRGNKYISMTMKVTSESKNPLLPVLALYSISGGEMKYEGQFTTEFARWKNYGTYLGNNHDFGNDFAKTSTINFKLGCEESEEVFKKAYAVVLKKENVLTRSDDKYKNPPVSYKGYGDFKYSLTTSDFSDDGQYILIKLSNL